MDSESCSQCCCVFSASGIVFLMLIGILLKTEPLYIQGIDEPDAAADNCFVAAGIYAGFVIGTSFLILRNNKRASNSHRDVDDTHSSELAGIVGQNESKFGGGGGGGGGYGSAMPTRGATLR